VNELRRFTVKFVAYYFPQPRQLFEPMILPPGVSNRQINQLKQSGEGVFEANLIAPLFPSQRPLILAADVAQLGGERQR